MAARETKEAQALRWKKLELLQKHYASFPEFMRDMMAELGFQASWMQEDIASFLQHGPKYLMVQAQRGEAKTTITAMFAVWCLIHDPSHRVLIVSAGGKTANEIATLVQRLILTVDVLECLRPDPSAGDRTSVEAFDVHYTLKGIDKSPSVACVGITGNLPGKRADLLIADDVESTKNSMTAAMRATLMLLTLEFPSICSRGRIVYLGTPQTSESIYNTLPGKGFTVRIWPGRYPNPKEREVYGDMLAPSLVRNLEANPGLAFGGGLTGSKGQPTDPTLLDEEALCTKEQQGESYFQLNFMLNTSLSDSMRYPLKLDQIIVLRNGDGKHFPTAVMRGMGAQHQKAYTSSGLGFTLSLPHTMSDELSTLQGVHMAIDPAGGGANADETGYAVTGFLNGNVFVLAVGGLPGGYSPDVLAELASIAVKYLPNTITIEKNMGHGAFAQVFLPILRKAYEAAVLEGRLEHTHKAPNIEEPFVTGQKEARIIGTLEPVMGRGSLIFMESVIAEDDARTSVYEAQKRSTYSVFHQLSKITKQKNSLAHDDRGDALESSVSHWTQYLSIDQEKRAEAQKKAELDAFMRDPRGRNRYATAPARTATTMISRYMR